MSTSGILLVNGRDLDDLNVKVLGLRDLWSGLEHDRAAAQPYGALGSFPVAEARVPPREVRATVALEASKSNRVSRLDDLLSWIGPGTVELSVGDQADRLYFARLETVDGEARWESVSWLSGTLDGSLEVELGFVCYDPLRYYEREEILALGPTGRDIPLGSAPSAGVVEIGGPATDPAIRYRGIDGDELASLVFSKTVADGETLVVDLGAQTVELVDTSGTVTDEIDAVDSGWFFNLDPGDGDREQSAWPTLEVSGGEAFLRYRRAWLS